MLKIGEFAWLSQVTVEALRHYDRIGLLKPAQLDRFTGYRYYSLDQLPRLNRILALKDLGLSLNEIARMLDRDVSVSEIRDILRSRQAGLQEQIREARDRLARVQARLEQIEMEGRMPEFEVLLKTVEAQWIASVRAQIASWDQEVVGPAMTRMFDRVGAYLCSLGADFCGRGIALYHESESTKPGKGRAGIDVETAAPIDEPLAEGEGVVVRQLPRAQVAYAVHHGSYTGLGPAKQAVFSWMEENGYRSAGPAREVYLHFDPNRQANADSPHHVTEVQVPVERA